MVTLVTKTPLRAAEWICSGEVAAFPTETVYGLGADATNPSAVNKIYQAKRRPSDNPLIVHVSALEWVDEIAHSITEEARSLMAAFFPGPLTLVLTRSKHIPAQVTAGLDTVGVRMPDNDVAQAFIEACGCPVAAPSANLSGRPSPTTWQAVFQDLSGRIPCILTGEDSRVGIESTVVDCTGRRPVILRPGAVTDEMLCAVVPATIGSSRRIASARVASARVPTESGTSGTEAPRSPGMRHRHYAPKATVRLVGSPMNVPADSAAAYIGMMRHPQPESLGYCLHPDDVETYARDLFSFFRSCDERGIVTIYCQKPEPEWIGLAVLDRLERAEKR